MRPQIKAALKAQSLAGARGASVPAITVGDRQQNSGDVRTAGSKTSWKHLFLVTEDFSFWARRRPLAREAQTAGAEVWIMTCPGPFAEKLKLEGFRVIPWQVSRASLNPLRELYAFLQVLRVYRSLQPDRVHHFAMKPVVYGGLAARIYKRISCVHSIVGLGSAFTAENRTMHLVRWFLLLLLRMALKRKDATRIFQNQDNLNYLVRSE